MKKQYSYWVLLFFVFLSIFLKGYYLLQRSFVDNDEGIYLTSFLLVNKGYKLYKEVFFSQLPGFFLLVYPGFIFFGKTLWAARFSVFFWSLIGSLGTVWLLKEIKKIYLAPIAVTLIWLIPKFSNQATIIQSDILASSFSVLTLTAYFSYLNRKKNVWLILSSFFFLVAFLTKLDVSTAIIISLQFLLLPIPIIMGTLFIIFFGFKEVWLNTFGLRLLAGKIYPVSPLLFWRYLVEDKFLLGLTVVLIVLLIIKIFQKKINKKNLLIVFWFFLTAGLIIFFRPIFPHHLSLLAVPLVLSTVLMLDHLLHLENKYWLILLMTIFLLTIQIKSIKKYNFFLSKDEVRIVDLIKERTEKEDLIITDEAKFYYLADRLPPPELADISLVRVLSGSINENNFTRIVKKYRPKMIILWNGRLEKIPNIRKNLSDIGYIAKVEGSIPYFSFSGPPPSQTRSPLKNSK